MAARRLSVAPEAAPLTALHASSSNALTALAEYVEASKHEARARQSLFATLSAGYPKDGPLSSALAALAAPSPSSSLSLPVAAAHSDLLTSVLGTALSGLQTLSERLGKKIDDRAEAKAAAEHCASTGMVHRAGSGVTWGAALVHLTLPPPIPRRCRQGWCAFRRCTQGLLARGARQTAGEQSKVADGA